MRVTMDISFRDFADFVGMKHVTVYRLFRDGKTKALESAFETKVKQTCNKGETLPKFKSVKINDKDTENETKVKQTCNNSETSKESERKEDLSPTPPIEENKGKENIIPPKLKSENIKFSSSIPPKGRRDSGEDEEISGEVKKGVFYPPTVGEVQAYIGVKGYLTDAEEFVAFYESKGWMIGKNRMKNWRMALVTWEKARKRKSTDNGYGKDRRNPRCVRGATPVLAASAKDYEGRF